MGIVNEKDFIKRVKNFSEISFKPGERKDLNMLDTHDLRYLNSGDFKANLHIHTQYSDGTMTVSELLDNAEKLSEKTNDFLIAITDHDTIDGAKEAEKLIENYNHVNICFGVEISTIGINFPNQTKPVQVHLLVYGINPHDQKLDSYLKIKRELKLQLAKDTIYRLNKALPNYDFNIEEASKCHIMIAKGQDEVAHPLKKYTAGKILLDYYIPDAEFSYDMPIKKFKYLFKGNEPYYKIYKKALEMYTGQELPDIPENIEKRIQIAREIYMQAHPSIGNMLEPFSSFEDAVEFVSGLNSGVMSIAHPARTKAYCPEFYSILFEHFKKHGKDKALFYEGCYQSYEGEYYQKWQSKIDEAAAKFNLIKTGGLDSHGKNIISRCPYS